MDAPTLILFAKTPRSGEVKTRFVPATTADNAAAIALEMIDDTVSKATACWRGPLKLMVSPDVSHPELKRIAVRYNISVMPQAPGDLGMKMESALCEALKTSNGAAVMGCDIPSVSADVLDVAFDRLNAGSNLIGPSADGGFYLIGTQQCIPGMFGQIEWGMHTVLESVLSRTAQKGIRFDVMLPCLMDIDTWENFVHLANTNTRYQKFLPSH